MATYTARCIKCDDMYFDIKVGKIYSVIIDHSLDSDTIRVIDESGSDYLYPTSYFEYIGGLIS